MYFYQLSFCENTSQHELLIPWLKAELRQVTLFEIITIKYILKYGKKAEWLSG